MIQFNDNILPDWNQQARLLRGDISAMRPTLTLRSGMFITDIPGYLILIDDINHTSSRLDGVKINDLRNAAHPRIIIAQYGYLAFVDNGKTMQFTLHDGEVHSMDLQEPDNYRRLAFRTQVINIQGAGSELVRTDTEYRTDREMAIIEMQANVDRAFDATEPLRKRITALLDQKFSYLYGDTFSCNMPDSVDDSTALSLVRNDASVLSRHIERNKQQIVTQKKIMDKYSVEIYKKYSIPTASLAFILIGVPLGTLSRRGGMGVAIAISLVLFVVYWASLIAGEDLAERGVVPPFWAMWSANFLIGGVGIYLITKVISEKPVFAFFRYAKS